jgi:hypothetical protein
VITGFQGWAFDQSNRIAAVRAGMSIAAFLLLFSTVAFARSPKAHHPPPAAPRSVNLTFMKKDGTCVDGAIARIQPKTVTVAQGQNPPVAIQRSDLLQVRQRDSLVFSARSSWADVEAVHLLPRESFSVKLHNGKIIKDRPLLITADGMVFKRFLWMKTRVAKAQIVTVDYLRMKPDSNAFDYFGQEAPGMLFFYPEFYDGLSGLEGRIPVRLYDAVRPQDDAPLKCLLH